MTLAVQPYRAIAATHVQRERPHVPQRGCEHRARPAAGHFLDRMGGASHQLPSHAERDHRRTCNWRRAAGGVIVYCRAPACGKNGPVVSTALRRLTRQHVWLAPLGHSAGAWPAYIFGTTGKTSSDSGTPFASSNPSAPRHAVPVTVTEQLWDPKMCTLLASFGSAFWRLGSPLRWPSCGSRPNLERVDRRRVLCEALMRL